MKKSIGAGNSDIVAATLFAAMSLAVVVHVRLRLLGMPLERDEGEYAYGGMLVLKGLSPYLYAYTMKLPGMAYLSAVSLAIFGKGSSAIRLGLLAANLMTALFVFLNGRRLFGASAGLFAAGVYGLLTLSQHLLGTFAHATHFIALFVLAAFLCISGGGKPPSQYRCLGAGLLFGGAFIIKQHALFFLIAGILTQFLTIRPLRAAAGGVFAMIAGFAVPYLALLLVVLKQGAFGSFWFWTVSYASRYATGLTPAMGWLNFKSQIVQIFGGTLPYWLLALAGLLFLLPGRNRREAAVVLPLFGAALAALCPGGYFRPHYFILVTPAVALLAGAAAGGAKLPNQLRMFFLTLFFGAAAFQFWQERWFLFAASPEEYVKKAYQTTKPFVEAKVVAAYLAKATPDGARIQVLGSEPEIYFYAGRLSASGYIYMYPLMEEQPFAVNMQQQMLQELTVSRPEYLVLVDDLSSWLAVSAAGELFRARLNDFVVMNGYELDGIAKVSRDSDSFYVFGNRARQFVPDTGSRILIYRLKKA